MPASTLAYLKRLVVYDDINGGFKIAKTGTAWGSVGKRGYGRVLVTGKGYYIHRLVWLWHHGKWPDHQIDHIDGDPLNNRIENLRDATNRENACNPVTNPVGRSGYRGVYRSVYRSKKNGKWIARINVKGRLIHLGYYDDPAIAHDHYRWARICYDRPFFD